MTTKREPPDVRVGQIWEDLDPRAAGRRVKVIQIVNVHLHDPGLSPESTPHAVVMHLGGGVGRSVIRVDRFRPWRNGYRLVADVPGEPDAAEDASADDDRLGPERDEG